jgi:hypothetical protein
MTLTIPQHRTPAGGRPPGWDALDMPREAGLTVLARPGLQQGPALAADDRLLLLVPEGSAEELPGLLLWLEWDGVDLDLLARDSLVLCDACAVHDAGDACVVPRGAARYWVRPPGNGSSTAPTRTDLARLVSVAATECHRLRLARAVGDSPAVRSDRATARDRTPRSHMPQSDAPRTQAPLTQADAFSYASRMLAGTRPRSFTS